MPTQARANSSHTYHPQGKPTVQRCQPLAAAVTLILSMLLTFASAVHAAVPGLPFTEDFTDTALQDPALTSGDWNTDEEALLIAQFKRRYGAFDAATGSDVGSAQSTRSLALADMDGEGHLDVMEGNYSQANRLFVRRMFNTARNQGGSLAVDGEAGNVTQALLSADVAWGDLSANTGVDYYLSNNGGLQWFLVRENKLFIFPTTGSDLRWRAELRSLSPVLSPRINRLRITTDPSGFEVVFRNGFEDP